MMKKSEKFKKAIYAVADCEKLSISEKAEIIETLLKEEYINRICEKQEETESGENENANS